jgi:glycosyltransferase involved in cell wall biosynthesis
MPEHRVSAGEASLYARPGDELHFAEALQLLMDDPELRATMGQKGRARIESSLAWHHQKQALLATYAKMLNNEQESAAIVAGQQSQATK